MRDYNAIPYRSPKQREQSGPPSAVSKFVPNMSMDYVRPSQHARHSQGGERSGSVRIETPSQRQQRTSLESTRRSNDSSKMFRKSIGSPPPSMSLQPKKQSSSSPTSSPQSTANTTNTETTLSAPNATDDTIRRLRNALVDDAHVKESSSQDYPNQQHQQHYMQNAAASKSDSEVMELRSTVRQLKRQLDKLHGEKQNLLEQFQQQLNRHDNTADNHSHDAASAQDARIGEMQVELDRAHAQILTANMVRKELEDTLEAEQYTWDLRVQDQERMIQQMQDECVTLADELLQCKQQWKDSEQQWSGQVQGLHQQLEKTMNEAQHWKNMQMEDDHDISDLKERLLELEQERSDLQSCLDEALKELEAVDAELQNDRGMNELHRENEHLRSLVEAGDGELVDSLRYLLRWLMERDGVEQESAHNTPSNAKELVAAIKSHLEGAPTSDRDMSATRQQVENLESQLSVYRGDLRAREESSNELRHSLKEAVSLLRPLQDAVAKADQEKLVLQNQLDEVNRDTHNDDVHETLAHLQEKLQRKEEECSRLQEQTESLTIQLSKANMTAATSLVSAHKALEAESPSLSKAREGLRAKRQMLADAQNRFSLLRSPNKVGVEVNNQAPVTRDAEQLEHMERSHEQALETVKEYERQINDLQNECKLLKGDLSGKEVEIRALEQTLADARRSNDENEMASRQQAQIRIRGLESSQKALQDELSVRKASERKLNKSLKEALSLLKPLQQHLEEAEAEKKEMWDELIMLRARASNVHRQGDEQEHVQGLEDTIRQLEFENSRLHDALEDMSQTVSQSHLSGHTSAVSKNDSRLREDFVELKSRYEVTRGRLEDAHVENHALVESIRRREKEERTMMDEIHGLHEQLAQTQAALEKAANALVAREGNIGGISYGRFSTDSQKTKHQLNGKERDDAPGATIRRLT
ncbi:hypothetical protein MPSEU_000936200 [Mayamaea pseudoterrestris]|nr:hypothetical protein MPSEU_000936200 [Mayamaea pseudoterrestris]